MSPPPRDVWKELDELKGRIREVESALKRAKDEMRLEVKDGFEGMKRSFPGLVEDGLKSIKDDVRRLAEAETARVAAELAAAERKKTALDQEAERLLQEERRLAIEEKQLANEAKRIENASGQFAVLDAPVQSKHKRRMAVYVLLGGLVSAVLGSGIWSALSHR